MLLPHCAAYLKMRPDNWHMQKKIRIYMITDYLNERR